MQSQKVTKKPKSSLGGRRNPRKTSPTAATATAADGAILSELSITDFIVTELEDLKITDNNNNPRSFSNSIKQECWEKAEKIKGRDPLRWRKDPLGNTVFRKLSGCPGCLCFDFDHILPFSKGGKSTLDNCQVLQATVNRSKGNRTDISRADLIERSSYCRVAGRDMDFLELSAYGNVNREENSIRCTIL